MIVSHRFHVDSRHLFYYYTILADILADKKVSYWAMTNLDGQSNCGVFRISLVEPEGVEPTVFQLQVTTAE